MPNKGDRFAAMGCEAEVTRVGPGWADLRVTQYTGASWTKRQPLPLPDDWRVLGDGQDWTIHPGVTWREIIKTSGYTQGEVAAGMGISEKHLSRIVNAQALPGVATTVAFARTTMVSPTAMWRLVCDHQLGLFLGHTDLTPDYL